MTPKYDVVIEVPEAWEAVFPDAQAIAVELTAIGLRVLFLEPDSDNNLNEELPELVMVRTAVRSDPERFTHLPEFPLTDEIECQHEFGALGAVSGSYCIHCGADSKGTR